MLTCNPCKFFLPYDGKCELSGKATHARRGACCLFCPPKPGDFLPKGITPPTHIVQPLKLSQNGD